MMATPPMRRWDEGEVVAAEFGDGARILMASRVTSGPMPSPARTAILSFISLDSLKG